MTATQRELFNSFLQSCRNPPPQRSHVPVFDKLKDTEIAKFKEAEALNSGALLEAIVERGEGTTSPVQGDLVYIHFSIHDEENGDRTIYSTRPENGVTDGTPMAAILQKSPRLPRAWEIALQEMKRGERRILKVRPEFGFLHEDCEYHLPEGLKQEENRPMSIDLQLLNWHSSKNVVSVTGSNDERILKCILADGEGYENPRPPYRVRIQITLRKLASDGVQLKGEVLYSTNGEDLEVTMGNNNIPEIMQACLGSMTQKEKAICICSTRGEMDHNEQTSLFPKFPANLEQIEAEIEMVHVIQVRDIYGDGKIMKYRTVDGRGTFPSDCPLQDCRVDVHYKIRRWVHSKEENTPSSSWNFDSRMQQDGQPISVNLGCGALPSGMEACIHLMLPGEVSRVECAADNAYDNANIRCPIPPGLSATDDIEFEVELVSFEKGMLWAGISVSESLEEAKKMKNIANDLYKEGGTELAAKKYKSIVQQLSQLREFESDEQVQEADDLTINCFSNLASCAIQDAEYTAAVDWCNKALKINEENAKVLLRRAKAYSLRGDFDEAEADLREVERLDSSLKSDVQATLLKNKQRKRAEAQKQKDQFKNFFDRS